MSTAVDGKQKLVFTAARGGGAARNDDRGLRTMHLLTCIVRLTATGKHYAGPTEDELRKAAALGSEEFDSALSDLLNVQECVVHKYTQEGTAGPFAHRYAPLRDLTITVEWIPGAAKK